MPTLTLDAIGTQVALQDPFPSEGLLVIKCTPGTSVDKYVTFGQLQRIRDQLTALEEAGSLTYSVAASTKDARAAEAELSGLPEVDLLDTGTTTLSKAAGAQTGLVATGVNLHAGQTKASVVLGDATATDGFITIEAVIPGAEGNDINIELETGAGEAIGVVGDVITVTLNTGTSTYATIETLIQGDAAAAALVLATKGGAGTDTCAVEPITFLVDGQGAGVAISIGGIAAAISEVADDGLTITYGINVSTLTAGDAAVFNLRSGGQLNQIGAQIVT